jgi:hypothetical protein
VYIGVSIDLIWEASFLITTVMRAMPVVMFGIEQLRIHVFIKAREGRKSGILTVEYP